MLRAAARSARAAGPGRAGNSGCNDSRADRRSRRRRRACRSGTEQRIRRGRRRRARAAGRSARRGAQARPAHARPQLPRRDAHRRRAECHLFSGERAAGQARPRLSVWRHVHGDPRLGARRGGWLQQRRIAGRGGGYRLRRGAEFPGRRSRHRRDPDVHRGYPRRTPLRLRAARRGTRQARDRAQGRPPLPATPGPWSAATRCSTRRCAVAAP